jgi:predicted XRE-type DNA-binding protein
MRHSFGPSPCGHASAADLVKAALAREIVRSLGDRGLNQAQAARLLGVDQPKVSALAHGRLAGFSVDRLLRFLNALGRDVEIAVRDKPAGIPRARVRVTSAR